MAVDDPDVIDFASINQDGVAVLTISDHLEWDEGNEHLLILQNKINAYLAGIENGSLYKGYPSAKNRNIRIEVMVKYEPNSTGLRFFDSVEKTLKSAGYGFLFRVLNL